MQPLTSAISQVFAKSSTNPLRSITSSSGLKAFTSYRLLSTKSGSGGFEEGGWGDIGENGNASGSINDTEWETASSWSTGLTKEHFDGEAVGRQINVGEAGGRTVKSQYTDAKWTDLEMDKLKQLADEENRKSKAFVDGWGDRMKETSVLLKQVQEPGARGSYLKDSEKAEMYKLHKQNP